MTPTPPTPQQQRPPAGYPEVSWRYSWRGGPWPTCVLLVVGGPEGSAAAPGRGRATVPRPRSGKRSHTSSAAAVVWLVVCSLFVWMCTSAVFFSHINRVCPFPLECVFYSLYIYPIQ